MTAAKWGAVRWMRFEWLLAAALTLFSGTGIAQSRRIEPPPPLAGQYVSAAGLPHPYVFADRARYEALASMRTETGKKALNRLEGLTKFYLGHASEYAKAYSGPELNEYLHRLTFEGEGAAPVAAELALYAYLTGLNKGYGKPELAAQAQALSKAILLAWAQEGLRENGKFRRQLTQFIEDGKMTLASQLDVGLQIGRGMPFWVQAQDLLLALNAFDPREQQILDGFLDQVYELLVTAANFWQKRAYTDCERYSNHTSVRLLALLAIARLRNDEKRFMEAAVGDGHRLLVPWTLQVQENIYGVRDTLRAGHPNNEAPDKSYQISEVAPGEIVDRFRAGKLQTFGYPTYSLTELLLGAEILQNAGFQPMRFEGRRGQSLMLALHYYAHYYTLYLDDHLTVVPPGDPYPSNRQYAGHPVSDANGITIEGKDGALAPFLIGYGFDPHDTILLGVVRRAMSFAPRLAPFSGLNSLAMDRLAVLPDE
jgi:hypothetical protein